MKTMLRSVILALGVMGSGALVAQDINAVLEQARSGRQNEQQQFQQRDAQYQAADAATRQQMLNDARAQRDALAAQVAEKSETYSQNDLAISNLNTELRTKANGFGLGELFGLARQVANDSITGFQQSMTGAQFQNDRVQFLQDLSTTTRVLTVDQLERLWLEIQQEMTASGEVAKWNGSVVLPGGSTKTADIIRIGPFIAMSEGRYLTYRPELNLLSELPRQPPAEFMEDAARLTAATSGYVLATEDSTRGVMLNLYVERPTLEERIELGEAVGYVIIATGIAGGLAFLFQLLYLVKVRLAVARQVRRIEQPSKDNPLGRVLMAFRGNDSKALEDDSDVLELRLTEAVLKEIPALERSQALLRLVVAAGPLLGLVGTVMGMIITFQSITESGSSDPKLMATGIGQAMIATVLGLGVAVPLLFGNALLTSLSRGIIQILDEQSAGLLAETLENRRKPNA